MCVFTRVVISLMEIQGSEIIISTCKCCFGVKLGGNGNYQIVNFLGNLSLCVCMLFIPRHCLVNAQLWFALKTHQPSFLFIGCHDILLRISSQLPNYGSMWRWQTETSPMAAWGCRSTHVFIVGLWKWEWSPVLRWQNKQRSIWPPIWLGLAPPLVPSPKQWLGNMTTPTTGKISKLLSLCSSVSTRIKQILKQRN